MTQKFLAIILIIPFFLLSLYAVWQLGYLGIFEYHQHSPAGWQVFTDLVVACILLLSYLFIDARRNGRNPWPFVVITLFLGSFGPLLYILTGRTDNGDTQ
jgi:hypothetical protein